MDIKVSKYEIEMNDKKDKIIRYWEAYMDIVRERKGAWESHKYLYHVTKLPALEEMFQFGGLLSRHNYLSFKLLTQNSPNGKSWVDCLREELADEDINLFNALIFQSIQAINDGSQQQSLLQRWSSHIQNCSQPESNSKLVKALSALATYPTHGTLRFAIMTLRDCGPKLVAPITSMTDVDDTTSIADAEGIGLVGDSESLNLNPNKIEQPISSLRDACAKLCVKLEIVQKKVFFKSAKKAKMNLFSFLSECKSGQSWWKRLNEEMNETTNYSSERGYENATERLGFFSGVHFACTVGNAGQYANHYKELKKQNGSPVVFLMVKRPIQKYYRKRSPNEVKNWKACPAHPGSEFSKAYLKKRLPNQLEYTEAFKSIDWAHVNKLGEYLSSQTFSDEEEFEETKDRIKQYAMAECIRENFFPIEWVSQIVVFDNPYKNVNSLETVEGLVENYKSSIESNITEIERLLSDLVNSEIASQPSAMTSD
jgi:hypothetical protein